MLREITVKIELERINMQEGVTVEVLLDSRATELVMSSEFTRKQGFKLKKIKRPIYVRNVDGTLNKEGPIENTVEVYIYYQEHRCYGSRLKGSSQEATLVLSNTRELDRVPSTE